MKKTLIAAAVAVAVLGAGAFGAAAYGDKKIAAFYEGGLLEDKRIKIEGKPEMGLTGGTAKWTATITPDLCSPELNFTLRGEDTITRGVTGYHVESKVYFQPKNSNEEFFLLNADSKLTWSGNGNVKYTIPAGQYPVQGTQESGRGGVSWAEVNATTNIKRREKDGFQAADWTFNAPEFAFKDRDGTEILLQNISMKTVGDMYQTAGEAKGELVLGKLLVQAKKNGQNQAIEMSNLRQVSSQSGSAQTLDLLSQITVDSVRYENNTFRNIKFNFDVKGLSQAAMQKWVDFSKRQGQECVKHSEVNKELEQLGLLLVKNGFVVESKGNEMTFNNKHKATLDMQASVPAGEYANLQELVRMLPEKLQYSLNAVLDKPLLDSLGVFTQHGVAMSDTDVDLMLMQVPPPFKAVREGQQIKLSVQK